MKYKLVQNSDTDLLYVCLLGWGMDERPVLPLVKKENALLLYDFRNFNLDFDFSKFKKFNLLAFSYGVLLAALLKDTLPKFEQKVAVNGVFDMATGLSASFRKSVKELSLQNYLDFRKNFLISTQAEFEEFNAHSPLRTIEDCQEELSCFEKYEKEKITPFQFDKIFISEEDKVLPPENQKRAWAGQSYKTIKGNHFAFYRAQKLSDFFQNTH